MNTPHEETNTSPLEADDLPVMIAAIFDADTSRHDGPGTAHLMLRAHQSGVTTLLIEQGELGQVIDLVGDQVGQATVYDSQTVTVICRSGGSIVAVGVFEVRVASAELLGLLIPRAVSNLLLMQGEAGHEA